MSCNILSATRATQKELLLQPLQEFQVFFLCFRGRQAGGARLLKPRHPCGLSDLPKLAGDTCTFNFRPALLPQTLNQELSFASSGKLSTTRSETNDILCDYDDIASLLRLRLCARSLTLLLGAFRARVENNDGPGTCVFLLSFCFFFFLSFRTLFDLIHCIVSIDWYERVYNLKTCLGDESFHAT